jgi:hypothetical protein
MPETEDGGFQIIDKRGTAKDEEKETAVNDLSASTNVSAEADSVKAGEEVNFVSFLLSLYSSALAAFGKVPDPLSGKENVQIEAGKQMIDILGILQEKTKGNLNSEENMLLDNILYELRMTYLEKTHKITL